MSRSTRGRQRPCAFTWIWPDHLARWPGVSPRRAGTPPDVSSHQLGPATTTALANLRPGAGAPGGVPTGRTGARRARRNEIARHVAATGGKAKRECSGTIATLVEHRQFLAGTARSGKRPAAAPTGAAAKRAKIDSRSSPNARTVARGGAGRTRVRTWKKRMVSPRRWARSAEGPGPETVTSSFENRGDAAEPRKRRSRAAHLDQRASPTPHHLPTAQAAPRKRAKPRQRHCGNESARRSAGAVGKHLQLRPTPIQDRKAESSGRHAQCAAARAA